MFGNSNEPFINLYAIFHLININCKKSFFSCSLVLEH